MARLVIDKVVNGAPGVGRLVAYRVDGCPFPEGWNRVQGCPFDGVANCTATGGHSEGCQGWFYQSHSLEARDMFYGTGQQDSLKLLKF